jgi:acetylornithine deacetylase/succinyl-diaminopimelate desuccinylase-like protein
VGPDDGGQGHESQVGRLQELLHQEFQQRPVAVAVAATGLLSKRILTNQLMTPIRLLAVPLLAIASSVFAQPSSPHDRLAREIYAELVNIDTSSKAGTTRAAEAMAKRLLAAGFPASDVRVVGAAPNEQNLVARLRGTGAAKPVLLLAHLDVVDARKEDWTVDPFTFLEKDGYFYGRGTTDDKAQAAIWVATLIRFRQEGFTPNRDLIVALTADEEGWGQANGVNWLIKNHRALIDAEYCINEGGGGQIKDGRRLVNEVQAAEKHYATFRVEAKNKGGHSSLPVRDNAIYRLSAALGKLASYDFPIHLTEVTTAFFKRTAAIVGGQDGADMKAVVTSSKPDPAAADRLSKTPLYNAMLRTTCVATMLEGGHAENALPQTARATVNCRLIPGEKPADILRTLERVMDDKTLTVTALTDYPTSPVSSLRPDLLQIVERVTNDVWPGVPVIPIMSTGGTDGTFLRIAGIPTYGISGLFEDIDDVRAHGKDERLEVKSFYEGREFLYRLVKELAR